MKSILKDISNNSSLIKENETKKPISEKQHPPAQAYFIFLKGSEWRKLSIKSKEEYIEQAFNYWRNKGFPYYFLNKADIKRYYIQLMKTSSKNIFLPNREIQWSSVGLSLANYFHPQMWIIKSDRYLSPEECFTDDVILKRCIERALEIWPDRYGANSSNLRRMLSSFTNAKRVSNFRPTVAKAIYERYSATGARVLDFCAGFGGRLLGCLTLERKYVGYEASYDQYQGLQRMYEAIKKLRLTKCGVSLHLARAEDAISKEKVGSFDIVFTSPPYYNREKYTPSPGQSYNYCKNYTTWRKSFLHHMIKESWRVLSIGGILVLNVANTENACIADDTKLISDKYFDILKTYRLRMGLLPYQRNGHTSSYRN